MGYLLCFQHLYCTALYCTVMYCMYCNVLLYRTVLGSPAEVLQRLPDGELPVQRELLGHVADTGPGHPAAEGQYYLRLRLALSITYYLDQR